LCRKNPRDDPQKQVPAKPKLSTCLQQRKPRICAAVVIRFGLDSNDVRSTVKLTNERIYS